jgi:MFS family permease
MRGPLTPAPPRRRPWPAFLLQERARPDRIRNRPGAWWLAVGTVCFGAFMGQLGASIVTLTYRGLRTEFHAPLAAVEWVSLAYLLALVALLVPMGRLADAHGRKLLYLYGFVVFTAASAACGLAPTLGALVGFRVVQAVGAAMMQANSVALVATSAPRDRMRTALGVQAAAQALGLALGPTVGGALVSTFDWPGLALLALATTAALLGVSAASGLAVPGWGAAVLFAVALAAGWGFVVRQGRAATPLLDLALLRLRAVAAGLVGALCGYLVLFGPLVLVPVVLTGAGSSELAAGLVLTALPAGFAVAATGADRLLPHGMSDRGRCVVGAALCAGTLGVLLAVPLGAVWLTPLLAVLGVGLGVFTPANNTLIMGAVPSSSSGTGGGLVNMARGLGTALGVALVTLALHLSVGYGARLALVLLLAAAALAALAAWCSPRATRV